MTSATAGDIVCGNGVATCSKSYVVDGMSGNTISGVNQFDIALPGVVGPGTSVRSGRRKHILEDPGTCGGCATCSSF